MILTIQQHILQEQKRFPGASGEFSWLLSGITLATKMIQARVRRAGLTDILGDAGEINIQGEAQQKLVMHRPETVGQAARIQGITPAAISLLLVHLKRRSAALEKSA